MFVKSIRTAMNISGLPFEPSFVSDDDDIEEEKSQPFMAWSINDKYYFSVSLPKKRLDKVDVRWGIYSVNAKRDPKFKKAAAELCEIQELLDKDKDISVDGVKYFVNYDEGYLGIEAIERKAISELKKQQYIQYVVDNILAFANRAWPVIKTNLVSR